MDPNGHQQTEEDVGGDEEYCDGGEEYGYGDEEYGDTCIGGYALVVSLRPNVAVPPVIPI